LDSVRPAKGRVGDQPTGGQGSLSGELPANQLAWLTELLLCDLLGPKQRVQPHPSGPTRTSHLRQKQQQQVATSISADLQHWRPCASAARVVSAAQQAHKKRCTNPGQNVNRLAELPRRTRSPPIAQRQPCRRLRHGDRGCGCESHSIAQHMYIISERSWGRAAPAPDACRDINARRENHP
jgi:hypothetical protein